MFCISPLKIYRFEWLIDTLVWLSPKKYFYVGLSFSKCLIWLSFLMGIYVENVLPIFPLSNKLHSPLCVHKGEFLENVECWWLIQAWNRELCFTTVVVDHDIGLFKTWNFPLLDIHALSFPLKVKASLLYIKI